MAIERSNRAQVLDLSRPGAVEVEIDVSEAAEVLMSICALGDREDHDTLDLGAEWLKAKLDAVSPDLMAIVDELMLGSMKAAAHLLGIVLRDAEAADVRRVPRAARGDRSGRAEAAPVRLLRQLVQPSRRARRDRARRPR